MLLLMLLFSCCIISLHTNALNGQVIAINVNNLIDFVIDSAKSQLKTTLEPIHLPDDDKPFVVKLGLIDLIGEIKSRNGTMSGLSTLDRIGNASYYHNSIVLKLGTPKLTFSYDTEILILNQVSTAAHVIGSIQNITINSDLSFDSIGNLWLKHFVIEDFQHIQVEMQGSSIFDAIAQPMTDAMVEVGRDKIKTELTHIMDTVIGPLFQQVHQ